MILSAADLSARINHPRNSVRNRAAVGAKASRSDRQLDRNDIPAGPDLFIRNSTKGRRPGDSDIPEEVKIPATILAKLGVETDEITETFNLGPSTVHALKNDQRISDDARMVVQSALDRIRGQVTDRLEEAIGAITPDKLLNAKAGEIANVARSMAGIIKDISPADKQDASRVQVVIHTVNQKDDSHYEVIEVNT